MAAAYYTASLNEVLVISYNVPVYWDDKFIGVIGIEIDYETLAREVENIKLYDSGYAFVLDEKGNFVCHPHLDSAALVNEDRPEAPDGLISNDSHVQYSYEGVKKTAVWMPLNNGMRLYVTVPTSEINRGWQSLVRNILLASFLTLLAVVAFTMRFANRLTQPLHQLTEAAKQVGNGNYDFALDYDKNDEVGILARTFEQLASKVKDNITSLNERINMDPLTSVRNKGAYAYCIQELQDSLDMSEEQEQAEFAIGVFDADNLKAINDTYGHAKGDLYLKTACNLICRTFQHSPVFRVGRDEFAVILRGEDYLNRNDLLAQFRKSREEICENAENEWDQVSVTLGLAVYDPTTDAGVIDVSRRADKLMYENKRIWKECSRRHRREDDGRRVQGVTQASPGGPKI